MSKNKLLLILNVSLMLILVGCGKISVKRDYDLNDHVKLGEYKGIEIKLNQIEVKESDIDLYIKSTILAELAEIKEVEGRDVIRQGDIIDLDYKGLLDGEAFAGGTAEGAELEIGSGKFIDGFEEQLIGVSVGQEVSLNLTFPEEYTSEDLAGKDVIFEVKINDIVSEKVYPLLTDEIVSEKTDFDTIGAYRADIKDKLEKGRDTKEKNEKIRKVFKVIKENSEIISYPEAKVEEYIAEMNKYYEGYAEAYGMEFEEFVNTYLNSSLEEYKERTKEMAEEAIGEQMIIESIASKEKIKLTKKELKEGIDKFLEEYSIETKEELFEQLSEEQLIDSLLWQKTLEYVADNAKVS